MWKPISYWCKPTGVSKLMSSYFNTESSVFIGPKCHLEKIKKFIKKKKPDVLIYSKNSNCQNIKKMAPWRLIDHSSL